MKLVEGQPLHPEIADGPPPTSAVQGVRLEDREPAGSRRRHGDAGAEAPGEFTEACDRLWAKRIPDPGAAPVPFDPASVAEDLEMVRDRRLAHVAAGGEV